MHSVFLDMCCAHKLFSLYLIQHKYWLLFVTYPICFKIINIYSFSFHTQCAQFVNILSVRFLFYSLPRTWITKWYVQLLSCMRYHDKHSGTCNLASGNNDLAMSHRLLFNSGSNSDCHWLGTQQ